MRTRAILGRTLLVLTVLFASVSTRAEASSIQFNLAVTFNAPAPQGAQPWILATFTDTAPGTVDLTIALFLQEASEYVSAIWFNLDPQYNPASVNIVPTGGTGPANTSISKVADNFPGDGGGSYDLRFIWPTPPPAQPSLFDGSETRTYTLTCPACPGFNAGSFLFYSVPGANGSFEAAAKIGGNNGVDTNFGYVGAVPEPSSMMLMGTGFAWLAAWTRRRSGKGGSR